MALLHYQDRMIPTDRYNVEVWKEIPPTESVILKCSGNQKVCLVVKLTEF